MKKYLLLLLVCLCPVSALALDSDARSFIDRMDRLERDLTLLQRKVYKEGVPVASQAQVVADSVQSKSDETTSVQTGDNYMYSRLTEIEQRFRELTGEIETLRFENQKLAEKIQKMNQDNAVRFEMLEKQVKALKTAEIKQEVKEKTQQKKGAKEAYEHAYSLLGDERYEASQKAFEKFLEDYPTDGLADNARYWLGETFYARRQYEKAAVAFASGINKKSSKGADCLLKLGMSMVYLDKKEDACTAFENLPTEFPKASDTLKQKAKSEAKKLSCP